MSDRKAALLAEVAYRQGTTSKDAMYRQARAALK
jgi:hypothetical protein